ncbi:MAG: carbohydrate ABC transporter permease [Alphaproteobacteria bacterium]
MGYAIYKRRKKTLLFLTVPFLVSLFFFLIAVVWTIFISFTNQKLTGIEAINPKIIGLKNYLYILKNSTFIDSLTITANFTFLSAIIGQCFIGILLAAFVRQGFIKRPVFIEIPILLGWIVPDTVAAFSWLALVDDTGFVNQVLSWLNIESTGSLMEHHGFFIITVNNVWKGLAWSYLLFTAAIDGVSREILEASTMDGVSAGRQIYHIIIPSILPQIFINLLLITIWTVGVFSIPYIMSNGNPDTNILGVFMYNQAFASQRIGLASSISVIMTCIVGVFAALYFYFQKKYEE